MANISISGEPPRTEWISRSRQRYLVFLLTVISALNFLDRQIIVILAEPIKAEFQLADWQVGVLTGLAFAMLYSTLSIPVARLADRSDRSVIVAGAVGLWSIFTLACGLAQTYVQLVVARLMVGVGEAGGTPPAHSLITDYTPREKWSLALGIHSSGLAIGGLIGLAMGGIVADVYGWRTAFIIAAIPGILVAAVAALTLRDPIRKASKGNATDIISWKAAMREIASKRCLVLFIVGSALVNLAGYGQLAFLPSFYLRTQADALGQIAEALNAATGWSLGAAGVLGIMLGLVAGILGGAGSILGGYLSDWWQKRHQYALLDVPIACAVIRMPVMLAALYWPTVEGSMALLAAALLLSGIAGGPTYAAVQSLVGPRTRSTASAIFLFSANFVGLGFGPLTVGILSDSFSSGGLGSAEGLRLSLAISCAALLIGAVIKLAGRSSYLSEVEPT